MLGSPFFHGCFPRSYLIVKEDKTLESYGLNAVCTHLGCVVPWSAANNKFMCPCHGSQYSPDGTVVRGPAPLPLALAHCDVAEDGKILFSPWTESDFRTGEKGWWN
jgi:cytochrome b6-f complex iron-sulfur subunit